jgi:hypothetical protein
MTNVDHHALVMRLAEAIGNQNWDALGTCYHPDAVLEYPQSGERFVGLENIKAQFANYPALEPGATTFEDVIGGTTYALSPLYTVLPVEGSGNRGTAVFRAGYPDGSNWWVLNIYELRGDLIARARAFFAPEFDPPDWRAPFRAPE